jgi:hypothetical protein
MILVNEWLGWRASPDDPVWRECIRRSPERHVSSRFFLVVRGNPMAIDLVGLVSQILTPQVVGGLARALGINEAVAQKLVSAAVPAVLAAFATTAAAPGGAKKIVDAVSNSDPDLLTKLSGALGGADAGPAQAGADFIKDLLGGSGLGALAGSLAQFSGAPAATAQAAAGVAAQAAIGAIGQQDPSNWSDASSIAAMFDSQKGTIAAALPSEISKALASTGLVAGLGDIGVAAARAAAAKVSAAASAAAAAPISAPPPPAAPARSGGFPSWIVIVIVVIVLAAIWWFVAQRQNAEPPKQGLIPAPVEFALADMSLWKV